MQTILMKITIAGSMDGFSTNLYKAGQKYPVDNNHINQGLADSFVNANFATYIRERMVVEPEERAVEVSAPEIKVAKDTGPKETKTEIEKEEISAQTFSDEPEIQEPKNTRVFALAKELKVGWEKIIKVANELDINVRAAQAGLTDSQVQEIKKAFEK